MQVTSSGLLSALCQGSKVMSQLTHLNLSCCSKLDTAVVVKLTQCLPLLHHLDLGSCFLLQVGAVRIGSGLFGGGKVGEGASYGGRPV